MAAFTGPQDPVSTIRRVLDTLSTPTVGDMLYVGQVFRTRIRERTTRGVDVNGAAFAPYSRRGPYYFYPNREVGLARGGTVRTQKARATAAGGRWKATGRVGKKTPYGIRYESYAAAKQAHGRSGVDLCGMEQHTHMLDTMLVHAGGVELRPDSQASELLAKCSQMTIGFYGAESARAKGNNEGISGRLPARRFFDLSAADLQVGSEAIGMRMEARAKAIG